MTAVFFTYNTEKSFYYAGIDFAFLLMVFGTAYLAYYALIGKNENAYRYC